MTSEIDRAWAAGLFEGEGCIHILGNEVRLNLASTDRDVVERFCEVVGAGRICVTKPGRHKPLHVWFTGRRPDSERILLDLLPWFGERRTEKANEALDVIGRSHRTCYCGKHFLARSTRHVYCSETCNGAARYSEFASAA